MAKTSFNSSKVYQKASIYNFQSYIFHYSEIIAFLGYWLHIVYLKLKISSLTICPWCNIVKKLPIHLSVLKRIFILGRIEYRILFVWWKLNESNIEYYSLIKKIFEYYSNTLKYSNIRIYSNKFAQNCKFFGSLNFSKPENMF